MLGVKRVNQSEKQKESGSEKWYGSSNKRRAEKLLMKDSQREKKVKEVVEGQCRKFSIEGQSKKQTPTFPEDAPMKHSGLQ
mmetsp:Transcript_6464/g.4861  ORF Transcript_6464/g.4861 Transcript_6464/m.4861 type:complete len:81 (-) Transcript_6464:32-274(-)